MGTLWREYMCVCANYVHLESLLYENPHNDGENLHNDDDNVYLKSLLYESLQ